MSDEKPWNTCSAERDGAACGRKTRSRTGLQCNTCRLAAWRAANPEKVKAQKSKSTAARSAAKALRENLGLSDEQLRQVKVLVDGGLDRDSAIIKVTEKG